VSDSEFDAVTHGCYQWGGISKFWCGFSTWYWSPRPHSSNVFFGFQRSRWFWFWFCEFRGEFCRPNVDEDCPIVDIELERRKLQQLERHVPALQGWAMLLSSDFLRGATLCIPARFFFSQKQGRKEKNRRKMREGSLWNSKSTRVARGTTHTVPWNGRGRKLWSWPRGSIAKGIPRVCHCVVTPASWDTHYQFSFKTLLSKVGCGLKWLVNPDNFFILRFILKFILNSTVTTSGLGFGVFLLDKPHWGGASWIRLLGCTNGMGWFHEILVPLGTQSCQIFNGLNRCASKNAVVRCNKKSGKYGFLYTKRKVVKNCTDSAAVTEPKKVQSPMFLHIPRA